MSGSHSTPHSFPPHHWHVQLQEGPHLWPEPQSDYQTPPRSLSYLTVFSMSALPVIKYCFSTEGNYYQPAGISWQTLEHLSEDLRLPKCTVRPPPPTCWPGRQLQQVAGLPYLQFSQIGEPNSLIRKYEPRAVGEDGLWGRKDLSHQAFGMTPGS